MSFSCRDVPGYSKYYVFCIMQLVVVHSLKVCRKKQTD
uniref:Uncharacterized protein n=1 Tax=Anguilla anguilla TaxID=7936 RepID=A0A0E9RNG3_ANGAN